MSTLQPHLEALLELAEAHKLDPYRNNQNKPVITGNNIAESDDFGTSLLSLQVENRELRSLIEQLFTIVQSQGGPNANIRTNDAISPIVSETTTKNDIAALTTGKDQQGLMDTASSEEQKQEPSQEILFSDITPVSSDEKPKEGSKGKGRDKKNKANTILAGPPVEPDASMPWDVNKAMQWADYFRSYAYPKSNHANSKYRRAREAAEIIIQRQIEEKQFVYVFKYMKGVDENFHSDYWYDKDIDIWTVNDHYEGQVKEIKRKKAVPLSPISLAEKREEKQTVKIKDLPYIRFSDNPLQSKPATSSKSIVDSEYRRQILAQALQ